MTVALATVAHDPRNVLVPKLRSHIDAIIETFDGVGVMASRSTSCETIEAFEAGGAIVEQEELADGVDTIGRRRRGSLRVALRTGASHVLYSDMDHVMRWLERDRDDLRSTLAALTAADFTIVGRSPEVFAEAPGPLRVTEGMCNAFYERLTGRPWELFIAVRGMSAEAAQLIVDGCDEDTIANDVAWPLFAESRGCSLRYREVDLPYENHTWFASGVSEKDRIEADPRAWAFRCKLAMQMFDAFDRWGPQARSAEISTSTWSRSSGSP